MTLSVAALFLAAALLVIPPHPRRRLLLGPARNIPAVPVAVAGTALGLILALTTSPPLTVAAMSVVALAASRRRASLRRRQRRQEGEAMTVVLETVVGELRVGAHPLQAFGIAAVEVSGSVGAALRAITARVELGADIDYGLTAVAAESAVPFYWDRIAVCWRLASDHGLAMATLMRAAQRDIADRQRFSSRVDASLAGARATAAILAGLPVMGILLGELVGARPVVFLLGGGLGGWMLMIGTGLIAAGVLWADRIVNRLAP